MHRLGRLRGEREQQLIKGGQPLVYSKVFTAQFDMKKNLYYVPFRLIALYYYSSVSKLNPLELTTP